MLWGLPIALSLIITEPLSGPTIDAVKVTVMTHFAPGAKVVQVLVWLKSAPFIPLMARLLNFSVAFPLFNREIA